jgi:lipopolysaccharide/colanic/teichoic acid biosynthesis glycosyltransferase
MLGDIELEKYGDFRDKVLSIRPGITGLWQVSGRHETTFEERLGMDNEYIDRWSIGLDFLILFKTIPEVLRMRGAQ